MQCKFPQVRDRLLDLLIKDQDALKELSKKIEGLSVLDKIDCIKPIAIECQKRSHEVLGLLRDIDEPTIENIGYEGSEAAIVLTLHSNVSVMEQVLAIYNKSIKKDPKSVALDYVSVLVDRISVVKTRKQKLGTIWLEDSGGEIFLVPIIDSKSVNKRRKKYGLGPIKNKASENDSLSEVISLQREISDDVYMMNFAYMDKDIT